MPIPLIIPVVLSTAKLGMSVWLATKDWRETRAKKAAEAETEAEKRPLTPEELREVERKAEEKMDARRPRALPLPPEEVAKWVKDAS